MNNKNFKALKNLLKEVGLKRANLILSTNNLSVNRFPIKNNKELYYVIEEDGGCQFYLGKENEEGTKHENLGVLSKEESEKMIKEIKSELRNNMSRFINNKK